MKVLIIGVDGQIGKNLWEAWNKTDSEVYGTSRRPSGNARVSVFDLNDSSNVAQLPICDVVFLCAAETKIAVCREDSFTTTQINVEAPIAMARYFAAQGCFVIFLSSYAVFDGSCPRISVDASRCPNTTYGEQKAVVEAKVLDLGDRTAVLRLAKVLSPTSGLLNDWIESLKDSNPVTAFQDMVFAPISLSLATDALIRIAIEREGGLYQISADYEISYVQAAQHIASRLGADQKLVRIVNSSDAGIPLGEVSHYATFDSSRVETLMGKSAPDPFDVIDNIFQFSLASSSDHLPC